MYAVTWASREVCILVVVVLIESPRAFNAALKGGNRAATFLAAYIMLSSIRISKNEWDRLGECVVLRRFRTASNKARGPCCVAGSFIG